MWHSDVNGIGRWKKRKKQEGKKKKKQQKEKAKRRRERKRKTSKCGGAAAACRVGACHGWEKGRGRNKNQERGTSFSLILKDVKNQRKGNIWRVFKIPSPTQTERKEEILRERDLDMHAWICTCGGENEGSNHGWTEVKDSGNDIYGGGDYICSVLFFFYFFSLNFWVIVGSDVMCCFFYFVMVEIGWQLLGSRGSFCLWL